MIIGLVLIFGAVVGIIAFSTKGAGYGLWWDIILGVAGSIISSCVMTAAYVLNQFGMADNIGFNWYSMTVGVIGALTMIYGTLLYNVANPIKQL